MSNPTDSLPTFTGVLNAEVVDVVEFRDLEAMEYVEYMEGGVEPIPFPAHAWPLLRNTLVHIATHPDEFYMGSWVVTDEDADTRAEVEAHTGLPFPECGTAACLAGHIEISTGRRPVDLWQAYSIGRDALMSLGLVPNSTAWHRMANVFEAVDVRTYEELCNVLSEWFTFPEPFPQAADTVQIPDEIPAVAGRV